MFTKTLNKLIYSLFSVIHKAVIMKKRFYLFDYYSHTKIKSITCNILNKKMFCQACIVCLYTCS